MPASPPGEQNQSASLDLIWAVAGIVLILILLWFFARGPVIKIILIYKSYQIDLVSLFTQDLLPVKYAIDAHIPNPRSVTIDQLGFWLSEVGRYYRFFIAGFLVLGAGLLFVFHPGLKYKNTFTMTRLRSLEKENWPQITPLESLNLVDEDIDEGPWAMSPSPMQFAKKYDLLEELPSDPNAPLTKATLKKTIQVRVNHEKALKVFAKQIGPLWQGIDKAPIHAKALFALFAARANQDRTGAAKLLAQIATSSRGGKLDFSGVAEVLKRNYKGGVLEVVDNHAYLYTVLASMLELARTDGVFSSSDFIWLKPLDRQLWYMLNSVGRRTAVSEIAGAFSHWLAEKAMGRKLAQPIVESAITGLEDAIKHITYTPEK